MTEVLPNINLKEDLKPSSAATSGHGSMSQDSGHSPSDSPRYRKKKRKKKPEHAETEEQKEKPANTHKRRPSKRPTYHGSDLKLPPLDSQNHGLTTGNNSLHRSSSDVTEPGKRRNSYWAMLKEKMDAEPNMDDQSKWQLVMRMRDAMTNRFTMRFQKWWEAEITKKREMDSRKKSSSLTLADKIKLRRQMVSYLCKSVNVIIFSMAQHYVNFYESKKISFRL